MRIPTKVASPPKTVLFADDSDDFQRPLAILLGKHGYRVLSACDGKDALQKARDFSGVIDLLLTDVDMPGMTGIALAAELTVDRPNTKVLLISGIDSGLFIRNPGWRFLRKPFLFNTLRAEIQDMLGEQPL